MSPAVASLTEDEWMLLNLAAIRHRTRNWKDQPDPAELLRTDPGSLAVAMALDDVPPLVPAVEAIVAARVAAALNEAADAIEAAVPTWHRGMYGCPDDMFARRDLTRIVRGLIP